MYGSHCLIALILTILLESTFYINLKEIFTGKKIRVSLLYKLFDRKYNVKTYFEYISHLLEIGNNLHRQTFQDM